MSTEAIAMAGSAITFTIPGPPQGKGRARVGKVAGHARMFTPAKTVAYESLIALAAAQAMHGRPPLIGPIACHVEAIFAVPASWAKAHRDDALAGRIYPTCKPDADNVLKAIGDGCNGVIWADDSRIVSSSIVKLYGPTPMVRVYVAPMVGRMTAEQAEAAEVAA